MRTSTGSIIEELTQALKELQLAQDRVNAVVNKIRQEKDNRTEQQETITTLPIAQVIEDTEAIPGTTLRLGDKVRILNPNRNQENSGRITGYRVTHTYTWIIVTTSLGRTIKRIAKNLRKF